MADAKVIFGCLRAPQLADIEEPARADRDRHLAVAAQPVDTAEVERVTLGVGDPRPIFGQAAIGRYNNRRWQLQHRAIGFEDQVMDAHDLRIDRIEQLVIERAAAFHVERIVDLPAILDLDDTVSDGLNFDRQLLPCNRNLESLC